MADYIEVDIPNLKTDVGDLGTELSRIRSVMGKMFEEIKALDRMWDGPANEAFNQQFESDYHLMEDMCRIVDGIISFGDNAKTEYINCENAVAAAIDTIKT